MIPVSSALIAVAKRPAPGQTKTRLSPPLSPQQAADLYECFLRDTLDLIRQVQGVRPVLACLPENELGYFRQLAPDFELIRQEGHDLGARLDNATTRFLREGCQKVVIMDSDSPTLPVEYLAQAFTTLRDENDLVIGPCDDGGYFLIGLSKPVPRLLREVRMSTPNVTADTLALAEEESLKAHLLPTWYDIDDANSLRRLRQELTGKDGATARHTRGFFAAADIPDISDREK